MAKKTPDAGSSRHLSLVQRAVAAVHEHMRNERVRVGETLPSEAFFAEKLGVSRSVMREAFAGLAALKIIDTGNGRKPQVGATDGSVLAISLEHAVVTSQITVAEIWDVRRILERQTAFLAAARRTDAEAERITETATLIGTAQGDPAIITEADIAFHALIAEASGNQLLYHIVTSFRGLMKIAIPTAWRTRTTEEQRQRSINDHLAIAAAIQAQDPDAADRAMAAHFDTAIGTLLRLGSY